MDETPGERRSLPSRIDDLERAVFGFLDRETSRWVPGLLQHFADFNTRQARMEKVGVAIGVALLLSVNVPWLRDAVVALLKLWGG